MTYLSASDKQNHELTGRVCVAASWKPATAWPTLLKQSDENRRGIVNVNFTSDQWWRGVKWNLPVHSWMQKRRLSSLVNFLHLNTCHFPEDCSTTRLHQSAIFAWVMWYTRDITTSIKVHVAMELSHSACAGERWHTHLTFSVPIETKVNQSKNPSCTSISSQEGNLQHCKHESHPVI